MRFRLPSADEKALYVLNQFDRIAGRYDLTNDLISMGMHRLWKNRAVTHLTGGRDGHYLDVCTGTGDLAIMIQRSLKAGSVTGLDFSPKMLAVAKRRQARIETKRKASSGAFEQGGGEVMPQQTAQTADLKWVEGDALALPFESDAFDGAIISFGLRNLTDYGRGIKEMARVVKPGGKVVNLDLGKPKGLLFTPLYLFYFRNIVPVIGQVIQGDRKAYTYLPESMRAYPAPSGISALFKEAGLEDIMHVPLSSGSVALHYGTVR